MHIISYCYTFVIVIMCVAVLWLNEMKSACVCVAESDEGQDITQVSNLFLLSFENEVSVSVSVKTLN